jgi:energy-coupling factor transporter ATP-binding protein EcfA2
MLVRLFGRNFRSLKDDFELSMVAADLTRPEDRERGIIEVPLSGATEPLRLLRTVAVYGANASGKSTLLKAGSALRWLATESSAHSRPDAKLPPYQPFLLDDKSRTAPIELGCDVVHKSSVLRYAIEFKERCILRETLSILDQDREVKLIERRPSGEVRGELVARSDANRLYVKEMQPNVAVLAKLAQHGPHQGDESVQPYYRAIRKATRYEDYSHALMGKFRGFPVAADDPFERFVNESDYRAWIMRHLIRTADVGICDVHFKPPETLVETVEVAFVHEGTSNGAIDFLDESSGTQKLFNISGDWWALANEPHTLLADELSASLHPRLLDRMVRAVNEPPTRVKSQLIFATHDTGLLESHDGEPPALRRDQVYFTKKNANGASELYSLAEFKEEARPVHNIRKRYLSGLYGAIPSVEKLSL